MKYLILMVFLTLISLSDFRFFKIPNRYLIALLVLWLSEPSLKALLCAFLLTAFVLGVSALSKIVWKRGTLSAGDTKLIFTVSLFLTFTEGLYMLLAACLSSLFLFVLFRKEGRFPLGPAISFGTFGVLLFRFFS